VYVQYGSLIFADDLQIQRSYSWTIVKGENPGRSWLFPVPYTVKSLDLLKTLVAVFTNRSKVITKKL
jgi:hypothetical protein